MEQVWKEGTKKIRTSAKREADSVELRATSYTQLIEITSYRLYAVNWKLFQTEPKKAKKNKKPQDIIKQSTNKTNKQKNQ